MRLDYRKTFIIGLGFFAITLTWSIYNSYVGPFLKALLEGNPYQNTITGVILTLDNIAAITLIPVFGSLSDRTWTRVGRRMPYIMVFMPIAGLLFALIPAVRLGLVSLISLLVVMNITMAAFRAPAIALMPDVTLPEFRSKANGVINLMGGVGGVLAFAVGSQLYKVWEFYPFVLSGGLLVLIPFVMYVFVRESRNTEVESEETPGIFATGKEILRSKEKSALYLLGAVFFWFIGWSGVEAFFTIYATSVWGVDEGTAAFYLTFFSLPFVVFALPAGILAGFIGRRRTINIGLVLFALIMGGMALVTTQSLIGVGLAFAGAFWALININSYPMVVDIAGPGQVGTYTGMYYFASQLAAILAPVVFGRLMDWFGYGTMFPMAALGLVIAFLLFAGVRRGDVAQHQAQ